jgi:uncharacterized membrane protein (DUF485 family)
MNKKSNQRTGGLSRSMVMDERQVDAILQNPKFKEMVTKKSKLSWTLTAIMLFVYVGFMLLVGYNKEFLLTPISPGSVTTWGIPLGLSIIVLSFVLCGVYSYIANSKLDQLNDEAMREVEAITHEKGQH